MCGLVACCALMLNASAVFAQGAFDGRWHVTMTCPPHAAADDDAKGYTHHFPIEIESGKLRGTYGTEGDPGWVRLHGPIAADGSATLTLDGIVKSPAHAIHKAQRGKAYTYRVRAQFEGSSGTGQRLSGRRCDFHFTRDTAAR